MKIKILEIGDEKLLLEFLLKLSPETLELWYFYGKQFDLKKAQEILNDFSSLKIAGLDEEERIVVLGHLYKFKNDSCRLGIVAGITGKGYGTKMMKILINFAKASGCKKIFLSTYQDNNPALGLYKKFGFIIVKEFNDRSKKTYEMKLEF